MVSYAREYYHCSMRKKTLLAVGERIRALREKAGVTQEEFAEIAGLDRAYYGGVERGERNVAAVNLIRIAVALNIEVGELFPPQADLIKLLRGMKK